MDTRRCSDLPLRFVAALVVGTAWLPYAPVWIALLLIALTIYRTILEQQHPESRMRLIDRQERTPFRAHYRCHLLSRLGRIS